MVCTARQLWTRWSAALQASSEFSTCFCLVDLEIVTQRVETGPRGPGLPEDEELEEVRPQEELGPHGAQCAGDSQWKKTTSQRQILAMY